MKATALAAMTCISGPPWMPGKTALSTAAPSVGACERDAAARSAERLVGGRRDQVRVRERAGMQARRDEARDVRHVHEQQRVHAVGDGRHALEVDDPGVGAGARHDHPAAGPPAPGARGRRSRCAGRPRARRRRATSYSLPEKLRAMPWVRWPPWARFMPRMRSPGLSTRSRRPCWPGRPSGAGR